jgi:iron(III)-enterobactin esterase
MIMIINIIIVCILVFMIKKGKSSSDLLNEYACLYAQQGPDAWWHSMQKLGLPLIRRISSNQCDVLFLWRDPAGDEQSSSIVTVYMDVNSVTDHHSLTPTAMRHVPDTDIWYWQVTLPSNWRGSYQFIPLTSVDLPQWNDIEDRRSQQRRWWLSIIQHSVPDELNHWRGHSGHGGAPLSALHLPDAPSQHAWHGHDLGLDTEPAALTMLKWQSILLNNTRRIWIYEPHTVGLDEDQLAERPLVIMLDGAFWAENMPIFSALDHETNTGRIPPALYLLIDEISGEQRSAELPCNDLFWQAIMTELLQWIEQDYRYSSEAEKRVIAGQSFGGLAALYAAYHWPETFGCAVSQSGSFWWPDVTLLQQNQDIIHGRLPGARGWLVDHIEQNPIDKPLNVYLEAGTREGEMIDLSESMYHVLKAAGHNVHFQPFEGGHDRLCWRGSLLDALSLLLARPATTLK